MARGIGGEITHFRGIIGFQCILSQRKKEGMYYMYPYVMYVSVQKGHVSKRGRKLKMTMYLMTYGDDWFGNYIF
jgi:hypothetical protein